MVVPSLRLEPIEPAKILIVEDEALIAEHLSSTLSRLGYEVAGIAESSEEALATISESHPDLILMDIRIRGEMDGIATAAEIRDRFDIPLIYLTAHSDQETINRAKMTGAWGFLPKPFHHMTLAASIETAIHKHRADQARKDIVELKRSSEATVRSLFKKTEEFFQVVVEAAPKAMVVVGSEGLITLVNTQTERLFGYNRRELLGQPVEMLVPERFRGNHGGLRKGFFATPSTRAMGMGRDLFAQRRDGTEVPVEIGLNPISTADGQFVLASIIDITERKKTVERFQVVVEAAPNSIIMVGADGRITLVNTQTEKLFGYHRRELLGRPVEMLVPERFRKNHSGLRTGFFAAPSARAMGAGRDLFALRKDGNEVPVEIGLNPISTADGPFVLASIIDISERKRTEESFELFKAMVHGVQDYGIFMLDPEGHVLSWNEGAKRMKGYSETEIVGQHFSRFYPPDAVNAGHPQEELRIAREEGRFEEEGWRVRRDGSRFWANVLITALRDKDGNLRGFSKLVRDITERNQAHQEREGLIGRLEGALAEKTVLLKEVHHRVKNNLAVVAALLGMQANAMEDERLTLVLQKSQQRVASMALIHEYLYATDHLDRVNFGQYVHQLASELCLSYAISDEVSIAIEVEEIDLPMHRAIPCGLILNELLSNALKYGFPEDRPGKITVSFVRLETGELSLCCRDDGVGMAENFDWKNSKSLGLKIIQVLTKQLKGTMTLDRSQGGTSFELKFSDAGWKQA